VPNQIRDYFHLLGVGSTTPDPTIPFDNEFHLLGLDESDTDQQIAQKAKAAAASRSHEVDRRGQAYQNKRLDILLRDKINQAGMRFDGQANHVQEHREELHRLRERRLKDLAKDLCDSGKWTAAQAKDMIETLASTIGVAPDQLQKAVSDAVQSAGQWMTGTTPSAPPPPPVVPVVASDVFVVGRLRVPVWRLLLPIGLALGLINAWAGLAFGLSFLVLAWGKANAERKPGGSVTTRHLRWGGINAAVASLPLVALLVSPYATVAPDTKWAGEWDTDWGRMTFAVKSSRVTAQYESRTGGGQVDLKATNERQLDGSWCRPSCASPSDTGRLQLILDESGQTFKGWYTDGLDSEIKQSDDPAYQVNGRRKR
jgi:hypothetical protein